MSIEKLYNVLTRLKNYEAMLLSCGQTEPRRLELPKLQRAIQDIRTLILGRGH